MTDSNTPDGTEPVRPPTVPEVPASQDYTGEPTTPAPPPYQGVDPTVAAGSPPPPSGPSFDTNDEENRTSQQRPAAGADPSGPPESAPTAAVPGGPPPFDPNRAFATAPPPPGDEPSGRTRPGGLLVAGLVAVVLALGGALAFVVTQGGGDDDPEDMAAPTTDVDDEPGGSVAEASTTTTTTSSTTTTTTSSTTTTTILPTAAGNVGGEFTFLLPSTEAITAGSEVDVIRGITDSPETFVSTTDAVVALCAGLLADDAVEAEVVWTRDSDEIDRLPLQRFEAGEAGSCIGGEAPLEDGTYEVRLVDADGAESVPANITLGVGERVQSFLNDTDDLVCRIDLVESSALTYELFELNPGLDVGDDLTITVADTTHAVRTLGCDDDAVPSDEALFDPTDLAIGLATGAPVVEQLTSDEVEDLEGQIDTYPTVLSPSAQADAVTEIGNRSFFGRIATTEPSVTMCTGWPTPGPLDAAVVWEFNQVEIARIPASSEAGVIGACIEQGGEPYGTGSYQVYIATVDTFSDDAATFTAGRQQAQITFVNDTGAELCRIGFSPTLTNYYSLYDLVDANGDSTTFEPDTVFSVPAPVAEVDIRTFDCDDEIVTEILSVPPTDQVVSVTTGATV